MICAGKLAGIMRKRRQLNILVSILRFIAIFLKVLTLLTKKNTCNRDSLENDIKGANLQKCDSLLISNGIHREFNNGVGKISKNIYNLIALKKIYPNFISYNLSW